MYLINYFIEHYAQALALLGFAATILGTVRNALTYLGVGKGAQTKIGKAADVLSWVAEHGKSGLAGFVSAPGFASKNKQSDGTPVADNAKPKGDSNA